MKLLIFIHSLSAGGTERVTTNLANYWVEMGWAITIVTMTGREWDFYELHPDIRRIALRVDADSTNTLAAIRHNLRRVRALRAVLKQEKPDVAVGMMDTANCLLSMAATGTSIPTIGSERIHPPKLSIGRVWSWLRRRTYPCFAAVVAQTEESAQWLRKQTRVHRVPVIPNPVIYPLNSCEPRVRLEQVNDTGVSGYSLLAVGRLTPQKGFDRLLLAFTELSFLFPDWSLTILGEGACRNELESQVIDLGLEKRVFLPGVVGNVGEWYEVADLYVMTSLFEGFPNTLAEALAHGLPAVSVDCETADHAIFCVMELMAYWCLRMTMQPLSKHW